MCRTLNEVVASLLCTCSARKKDLILSQPIKPTFAVAPHTRRRLIAATEPCKAALTKDTECLIYPLEWSLVSGLSLEGFHAACTLTILLLVQFAKIKTILQQHRVI